MSIIIDPDRLLMLLCAIGMAVGSYTLGFWNGWSRRSAVEKGEAK